MKTIIKDVITFIRRFWTIAKVWVLKVISEHKFKNLLLLTIAFYLRYFVGGDIGGYWGVAVFFVWIGLNIESVLSVYHSLKEKNKW